MYYLSFALYRPGADLRIERAPGFNGTSELNRGCLEPSGLEGSGNHLDLEPSETLLKIKKKIKDEKPCTSSSVWHIY